MKFSWELLPLSSWKQSSSGVKGLPFLVALCMMCLCDCFFFNVSDIHRTCKSESWRSLLSNFLSRLKNVQNGVSTSVTCCNSSINLKFVKEIIIYCTLWNCSYDCAYGRKHKYHDTRTSFYFELHCFLGVIHVQAAQQNIPIFIPFKNKIVTYFCSRTRSLRMPPSQVCPSDDEIGDWHPTSPYGLVALICIRTDCSKSVFMIWHEFRTMFARITHETFPSLLFVPKCSYTSHIQYHAMSRYPTLQKSYYFI